MKTPEVACMDYCFYAEMVRIYTRKMRDNRCEYESKGKICASGFMEGEEKSCLDTFWSISVTPYGERPGMEYDDMCEGCKIRHQAFQDRREARKQLGAAKRSLERVGKKLRAESPMEAP